MTKKDKQAFSESVSRGGGLGRTTSASHLLALFFIAPLFLDSVVSDKE